jgi:hypothetical protein
MQNPTSIPPHSFQTIPMPNQQTPQFTPQAPIQSVQMPTMPKVPSRVIQDDDYDMDDGIIK